MKKAPQVSFVSENIDVTPPILIVDKNGFIGQALSLPLKSEFKIIMVPEPKGPKIPDIPYLLIVLVLDSSSKTKELIGEFITKAQKDKAKFALVVDLENYDREVSDDVLSYKDCYVFVMGNLFSQNLGGEGVTKLLYEAKTKGRVSVSHMGTRLVYPVLLEDSVLAIIDVLFSDKTPSRPYLVFPRHNYTEISLLHILKKKYPLLKIDFSKEDQVSEVIIPNGEYVLEEDYDVGRKMYQVIEEASFPSAPSIEERKPSKQGKFYKSILLYALLTFLFITFLPLVSAFTFSLLGKTYIAVAKDSLEKGNFASSQHSILLSEKFLSLSEGSAKILILQAKLLRVDSLVEPLNRQIRVGKEVAKGLRLVLSSVALFEKVFLGKSDNPKQEFTNATQNIREAIATFSLLSAEGQLANLDKGLFEKMEELRSNTKFIEATTDVFPYLFGFEGKRKYLVLFQNNMELRPGGGFIGSYGVLMLDQGRVLDFTIHDVYDADGQLKGHIEPPFAIRRYLPSAHWYLRDSNFDVDFTKSAKNTAQFLNKETGDVVDGVIAIDVTFLRKIISLIGKVKVSDYNETVTRDNVYLLTQKYVEKNTFFGSSQKKDFLRSLFSAITLEFSQSRRSYLEIVNVIGESIREKHLLFAFSKSWIQDVFNVANMSSSIADSRERRANRILDYQGISEANLGVNKTNYFVKRKVLQKTALDKEGRVLTTLSIDFNNTSTKESKQGGDYKNYLRVITPLGSKLKSIAIDSKSQPITPAVVDPLIYEAKNFKPPKELEVETINTEAQTIFGFLTIIPTQSQKKVSITYEFPQTVDLNSSEFSYDLIVFKQPGTDEYPFSFSLSYPSTFRALKIPDLTTQLKEDLNITIDFAKR